MPIPFPALHRQIKPLICWVSACYAALGYAQPDWQHMTQQFEHGIEDRQSLFNEYFNDEAPYKRISGFPVSDASFMFIAQGNHLISDRINTPDTSWQERHQHPHNQWNDLKLEGRPNGQWRYFINLNLTEPSLSVDEAYATVPVSLGIQLKAGQFYSGFGRLNSQHPHDRDFIDPPLIYQRLFGDSALLEKGLQLSFIPTNTLMIGAEQLSATNRDQFNHDQLEHGLNTLFSRWGNQWNHHTYSLIGISLAEGDLSTSDNITHPTQWKGLDVTIKHWMSEDHYWQLQGEWLNRTTTPSSAIGGHQGDYLMGLYRWHPQWRAGIRQEHANVTDESLPHSTRTSLLLEHDPNHWLRTRWQIGYETQSQGTEGFYAMMGWQATLQWFE